MQHSMAQLAVTATIQEFSECHGVWCCPWASGCLIRVVKASSCPCCDLRLKKPVSLVPALGPSFDSSSCIQRCQVSWLPVFSRPALTTALSACCRPDHRSAVSACLSLNREQTGPLCRHQLREEIPRPHSCSLIPRISSRSLSRTTAKDLPSSAQGL